MTIRNPLRRKVARDLTRALALMSAFMLALSVWTTVSATDTPASAATSAGPLTMTPSTGNSSTEFSFSLPAGAACTGDSAGGNYRVQTYIVPSSVDPASVTYDGLGPIQVVGEIRMSMYDISGASVVGLFTGSAGSPGGPGIVSGIPAMSWAVLLPGDLPIGEYNLGVACTVGQAGPTQVDNYWNATITIASDPDGGPAQFSYAPSTTATTTTTLGTTTTSEGGTTTTSEGGTTTTTGGGTTTTTGGSTTTASVLGGTFSGGTPSAASPVSTLGQLPYTGSSPLPIVVWAVALLVFGRMAVLLGRRVKVVEGGPTG